MTYSECTKGTEVTTKDKFSGIIVAGDIIDKDDLMRMVFIEWDDRDDPVWHNEDDLKNINIT